MLKAEHSEHKVDDPKEEEQDSDLPSQSSDVPLSTLGCLYILTSALASPILFNTSKPFLPALPSYTTLLSTLLPPPTSPSLSSTPAPTLDALFFLLFQINDTDPIPTPPSDADFTLILQQLSLLSANLPSPSQRYQAHQLASQILHTHPSDDVKLAQIRDTLEHCPYDNLKASATEWLKTEILTTNTPAEDSSGTDKSIFTSPALLHILAPFLWPGIKTTQDPTIDSYAPFQALQPFYLAVLNLLYLLIANTTIAENLGIMDFEPEISGQFLGPLMREAETFETIFLAEGQGDAGETGEMARARAAECAVVVMNCAQVREAFGTGMGG